MEKLSKSDLLKVVEEQRVKLTRYESRLRDVVTAYKSLSKEKEALEASLIAITTTQTDSAKGRKESVGEAGKSSHGEESTRKAEPESEETEENTLVTEDKQIHENEAEETPSEQLRLQLATLTNSLSTLSAEKSKMEAGFQADKRKLRQEKEEKERLIQDLQKQIKELEKQHRAELETVKSKLIVERHEREREHTDHGVMILELQKLTTEERNAKEQLEATILELKARALAADASEKKLGDAHNEMAAMKAKLRRSEETSPLLLQLQAEMAQLKQQHTVAIQEEQRRAKEAEDRARHLAAVHEERVANLESHLAELSESVGSYDRVRQQDQLAIQKLKDHIAQLSTVATPVLEKHEKDEASVELDSASSVQNILKNISKLKEQLIVTNRLSEKPIDIEDAIFSLFMDFGNRQTELHAACREEREKLLQELEQVKSTKVHSPLYHSRPREETATEALRIQIRSLQERVRMLNTQLEQVECAEQEWKAQATRFQQQLETEKAAWREKVSNLEGELRARAIQTEQQLTMQRERSLALLEDKEQEIRTLKSSFQMFLPLGKNNEASSLTEETSLNQLQNSELSDAASTRSTSDQTISGSLPGILLGTLQSETGMGSVGPGPADSPHILHYAHELARREVDISNLRKARNKLENTLRDTTKILAAERERHSEETLRLRESVARLERCQSREGANLEYLKNVVLSFLEPSSTGSKQHMLNAIGSVLRFSEDELDRVRRHSSNSWWYNAS